MRIPYRLPRLDDDRMLAQATATRDRMESRRTVRHFAPDPVPLEVIQQLVMAGSTAPSGAHRQPWHFVCIGDPDTKAKIRQAAEAEERRNYGGRMPEAWVEALEPLGTDAHKPYLEIAPWLIAVFAQDRGPEGKNYYVSESVGIAVGMLLAAIHEAGLVAVTHTPNPMKFLKDILGRPSGERAYMLLAVGHPTADCTVPDLQRRGPGQVMTVLR